MNDSLHVSTDRHITTRRAFLRTAGTSVAGASLLGRRVWLFIKHETYEGVVRAKVDIAFER